MDNGMATKKVTVTLPVEQLDAIRALVEARGARSASAFVQHAVAMALADVTGWGAVLADALVRTGGPLTKTERRWADGVLAAHPRKTARRRRRAA
jgi:Arc/MetJ-type ribon-helix-helix transcriptional regulator